MVCSMLIVGSLVGIDMAKKLSPTFVRRTTAPGRYSDGNGLLLVIRPGGGRSWIQRLTVQGKRIDRGLGPYPAVGLAEARKVAAENVAVARAGGDPFTKTAAVPTFAAAAREVLAIQRPGWKSPKHAKQWETTLSTYAYPKLANRLVSEITTADVLAVLMPIWHEKHETARRVRQRISKIMDWTVAHEYRKHNPAGDVLSAVLPRPGPAARSQHRPALHYSEVGAAVATVHASGRAYMATVLAFEFMVLTAARSGEVRFATWAEMDVEGATWTVPAGRMKAGREHRVPLSGRALAILAAARELPGGSPLIFAGARGAVLSDSTFSKLIRELGIGAVPHGFRSSFRDWAAEQTSAPHRVMEAALAHTIANKAEAAYARSDLFARRRELMQDWADYLAGDCDE